MQVDYFVRMGRGAYFEVAEASRNAYATLFEQLAKSYQDLVRTLRALRGLPQDILLPAWQGALSLAIDHAVESIGLQCAAVTHAHSTQHVDISAKAASAR